MKKIVVIGGGTGSYTVLKGLKDYNTKLSAVVSISDNGGSSGVLRDEFGVLPPGDLRRALLALSNENGIWRELFNYRFDGESQNHNMGNLIMTAMTKIKGDMPSAIEEISKILKIEGKVCPVSLDTVHLCAELEDGKVIRGETNIDIPKHDSENKIKKVYLEPKAFAYKGAIETIKSADLIVLGPGDLYTSIIPNLLVEGVCEALEKTEAKIVYVSNIMTKKGETDNFELNDFVTTIKKYLNCNIDYILANNKEPSAEISESYKAEKSYFVKPNITEGNYEVIKTDLIDEEPLAKENGKVRPLIRHDSKKLARALMEL